MARPTYTNVTDAQVALDAFIEDDLMEDIRDNQEAGRIEALAYHVTEQSTASASFVTLFSFKVTVHDLEDYTGISRRIVSWAEVKVSGGGTATYRLEDNASSDTGAEVTSTSASYEEKQPAIDVDASWKGTVRTINFQAKTTAGSAFAQAEYSNAAYLEF